MSKYIDADQIRAEIMRRIFEDYNGPDTEQDETAQGVCAGLLAFIDSLPEQPVNIPSAGSGAMGTTPPKFKLDVKKQPVEKQEEQKPQGVYVDCTEHPEWYGMPAKEQKPAEPAGKLSREEYLYQLLIDQLITYSDYEYLTGKKPAEWSEEGEKTIDDAYCWLCEYAGSLIQKNYEKSTMLYKIANRLKSLRPPFKPSEEQMKALINCVIGDEYDVHALVRLWAELKKL